MTTTISKITNEEEFEGLLWDEEEGFVLIENELFDSGRWVEYHQAVWSEKHDDGTHYFKYVYELPATEYQEGSEAEFDASGIEEVFPQTVTVTKYYSQVELNAIAAREAKKASS